MQTRARGDGAKRTGGTEQKRATGISNWLRGTAQKRVREPRVEYVDAHNRFSLRRALRARLLISSVKMLVHAQDYCARNALRRFVAPNPVAARPLHPRLRRLANTPETPTVSKSPKPELFSLSLEGAFLLRQGSCSGMFRARQFRTKERGIASRIVRLQVGYYPILQGHERLLTNGSEGTVNWALRIEKKSRGNERGRRRTDGPQN